MKFNFQDLSDIASSGGGRFNTTSLPEAYAFCKRLALGHYENFPVASLLIPAKYRLAVYAVYSFARTADDIADEHSLVPASERIKLLQNMSLMLSEPSQSPVFIALKDVIHKYDLPLEPFNKLLSAFIQDINFVSPQSWEDSLDYCSRSANPVGEIMLRIFNCYNEKNNSLSAKICTGLQLINFWQDFSVDIPNKRVYIPTQILELYNIQNQDLQNGNNSLNLANCINNILMFTDSLYRQGVDLIPGLKGIRFKFEIALTYAAGKKILEKLFRLNINILFVRPVLNKWDYLSIILNAFKLTLLKNGNA